MANMLNNPEAISQAMSMVTPEMMDQVGDYPYHASFCMKLISVSRSCAL